MRFCYTLLNDIRYQAKYGFYTLYAFITLFYLGILALVPGEHKHMAASIVLLTDPAALGFFFIGGIWLLEKGEGVHRFFVSSPLRPWEYCLAKALSLSLISMLTGLCIAAWGLPAPMNAPLLGLGLLLGAGFFTLAGLLLATYAKSVNHYIVIGVVPATVLIAPAILTAFQIEHFFLDLFPASLLWRVINSAVHGQPTEILPVLGLLCWLIAAALVVRHRIPQAMQAENGGQA